MAASRTRPASKDEARTRHQNKAHTAKSPTVVVYVETRKSVQGHNKAVLAKHKTSPLQFKLQTGKTGSPSRGPRSTFQLLHGCSQPSETLAPGNLTPCSGLWEQRKKSKQNIHMDDINLKDYSRRSLLSHSAK